MTLAEELSQDDRDAVLLWLRHATCSPRSRRKVATGILVRSVYLQALYEGCVDCDRCGDQGCDMCRPKHGRRIPW